MGWHIFGGGPQLWNNVLMDVHQTQLVFEDISITDLGFIPSV